MKSAINILRLASFNSLTVLAPQLVGLVLVVSIGERFGDSSRTAAGLATTLFGIAVVLSASGSPIVLRKASLEVRRVGGIAAAGGVAAGPGMGLEDWPQPARLAAIAARNMRTSFRTAH